MTDDPPHRFFGTPMSESIATLPGTLSDIPVGFWEILQLWHAGFDLSGADRTDFIRRSIFALFDAGARPMIGIGPELWKVETKYGNTKEEIADAVIAEWLQQGAPTPEWWTGLWFGLPEIHTGPHPDDRR